MKKLISCIIILCLCLAFTACTDPDMYENNGSDSVGQNQENTDSGGCNSNSGSPNTPNKPQLPDGEDDHTKDY